MDKGNRTCCPGVLGLKLRYDFGMISLWSKVFPFLSKVPKDIRNLSPAHGISVPIYIYIYISLATREGSGETAQSRSIIRDCTVCAHNNGSGQT